MVLPALIDQLACVIPDFTKPAAGDPAPERFFVHNFLNMLKKESTSSDDDSEPDEAT